jgi:hypothetical protein
MREANVEENGEQRPVVTKHSSIPAMPILLSVNVGYVVTRWVSYGLPARGLPILRTMLTLKVALLAAAAALAVRFGPFSNSDSLPALATRLTLVSAIAIQNAARARLARMTASVLAFALGCADAALFYSRISTFCFLFPPLLGLGTLAFRMAAYGGDVR